MTKKRNNNGELYAGKTNNQFNSTKVESVQHYKEMMKANANGQYDRRLKLNMTFFSSLRPEDISDSMAKLAKDYNCVWNFTGNKKKKGSDVSARGKIRQCIKDHIMTQYTDTELLEEMKRRGYAVADPSVIKKAEKYDAVAKVVKLFVD